MNLNFTNLIYGIVFLLTATFQSYQQRASWTRTSKCPNLYLINNQLASKSLFAPSHVVDKRVAMQTFMALIIAIPSLKIDVKRPWNYLAENRPIVVKCALLTSPLRNANFCALRKFNMLMPDEGLLVTEEHFGFLSFWYSLSASLNHLRKRRDGIIHSYICRYFYVKWLKRLLGRWTFQHRPRSCTKAYC